MNTRFAPALILMLSLIAAAAANAQPAAPHYAMSPAEQMNVRADGFEYDHRILVSLPPSYSTSPDRSYPVVWVTDGAMYYDAVTGTAGFYMMGQRIPELIIVGVGHPREEGMAGVAKRTADFFVPDSGLGDDPVADEYLSRTMGVDPASIFAETKGDLFLAFLVDQLRPMLAEKYRMADDHTLVGHSAGAAFGSRVLFTRPDAFDRYILGSGADSLTLKLEAEYAAANDDLDKIIFVGLGSLEWTNKGMASQRIISRSALLVENIVLREYPSLQLTGRLYSAEDHFSLIPRMISDGLRVVFAEEAKSLPKMPW